MLMINNHFPAAVILLNSVIITIIIIVINRNSGHALGGLELCVGGAGRVN